MGNIASAPDCAKEPTHIRLLNVVGQLSNIKCRLNDLKESLGVTEPELKNVTEVPTEVHPGNLVETIKRLPALISVEIDQIHRSIDQLNEALI